jgi:hypothetical protein
MRYLLYVLLISISIFFAGCNEEKRTFEVFHKNEERFSDISTNRATRASRGQGGREGGNVAAAVS